jgi:TonB family protein
LDEPLISPDAPPPPLEPGVTPIKILTKPRPKYTDAARQDNTEGKIIVAVVFGANGTIQHVLLLKRLGSGLDEEAVKAARAIKFEPMKRDGKPVAVVKQIEYTFEIF